MMSWWKKLLCICTVGLLYPFFRPKKTMNEVDEVVVHAMPVPFSNMRKFNNAIDDIFPEMPKQHRKEIIEKMLSGRRRGFERWVDRNNAKKYCEYVRQGVFLDNDIFVGSEGHFRASQWRG